MRNLQFLLIGSLLLAIFLMLGRLFQAEFTRAPDVAKIGFLLTWFIVTLFNLWVGITYAGYSISEELPIFILLFGLPILALCGLAYLKI